MLKSNQLNGSESQEQFEKLKVSGKQLKLTDLRALNASKKQAKLSSEVRVKMSEHDEIKYLESYRYEINDTALYNKTFGWLYSNTLFHQIANESLRNIVYERILNEVPYDDLDSENENYDWYSFHDLNCATLHYIWKKRCTFYKPSYLYDALSRLRIYAEEIEILDYTKYEIRLSEEIDYEQFLESTKSE